MYETFNCPPVHQEERTNEMQLSSHVAFYFCKNYVSKADLLCFQQKVCTKIICEVFCVWETLHYVNIISCLRKGYISSQSESCFALGDPTHFQTYSIPITQLIKEQKLELRLNFMFLCKCESR